MSEKGLKYLEEIQKECLQKRFKDNYEAAFQKMQANGSMNFNFEKYFESQPSMTQLDKEEFKKSQTTNKSVSKLQSKYEDIGSFTILQTIFDKVESSANKLNMSVSQKPILGTALSKEYNAFAVKVPDAEEYLIVFEGELFILSNILSKIISLSLPDFKRSDESVSFNLKISRIRNHIQTHPALQELFTDFVHNVISNAQPTKTKQYFLHESLGVMQYTLLNSLELFVVGHEYGHIYAGHLNDSSLTDFLYFGKNVSRISLDWEMEFEADLIGLNLLLNSLNDKSLLPFSYLGPEMFFTFLDISERANNLFNTGKETRFEGGGTHPPSFERRNRVRQLLRENIPDTHLESYNYTSQFLEDVMELHWNNFKFQNDLNPIFKQ
jgi:hypothetical protein